MVRASGNVSAATLVFQYDVQSIYCFAFMQLISDNHEMKGLTSDPSDETSKKGGKKSKKMKCL